MLAPRWRGVARDPGGAHLPAPKHRVGVRCTGGAAVVTARAALSRTVAVVIGTVAARAGAAYVVGRPAVVCGEGISVCGVPIGVVEDVAQVSAVRHGRRAGTG